jgi:YaiO family outer membrane protein
MRTARLLRALPLWWGAICVAQQPPASPPDTAQLPFRLEMGGYGSHVDNGYGNWYGGQTLLWIRTNPVFIPMIAFDSQTRPTGTQQNYSFFSYLNWTKSFYTTQGFSDAPQDNALAVYFPKRRYDIKANWKVLHEKSLVLGAGYTRFDLGAQGHGQIFNAGAIWYHKKLVVDGNIFVNRNQPGDFYSAAGTLAVQYGTEGKSWLGVTTGGGRELYRYVGQTVLDVRHNDYSFSAFYRRWLTRHVGVVVRFDYENLFDAFQRAGGASSLFFEF